VDAPTPASAASAPAGNACPPASASSTLAREGSPIAAATAATSASTAGDAKPFTAGPFTAGGVKPSATEAKPSAAVEAEASTASGPVLVPTRVTGRTYRWTGRVRRSWGAAAEYPTAVPSWVSA
jgi:hypothetical protein